MLTAVNKYESWLPEVLSSLYPESVENIAEASVGAQTGCGRAVLLKQAFIDDLLLFFYEDKGEILLWERDGKAIAALRVEVVEGCALIHDLRTAPAFRRMGYAKELLLATRQYLLNRGIDCVYSHVRKSNIASLKLHESVGFVAVKDFARLLDGTVSTEYQTMIWK